LSLDARLIRLHVFLRTVSRISSRSPVCSIIPRVDAARTYRYKHLAAYTDGPNTRFKNRD